MLSRPTGYALAVATPDYALAAADQADSPRTDSSSCSHEPTRRSPSGRDSQPEGSLMAALLAEQQSAGAVLRFQGESRIRVAAYSCNGPVDQ
jgi:hypothetical protein